MNLVVGATGLLGAAVCRRLGQAGLPVRAFARRTSRGAAALAEAGAEMAWGDLRDESSLAAACRGADAVVSTATATARKDDLAAVDLSGQLALVAAARAAGVRRFLYVSLSPNLPEESPLVRYKHEVERAVRGSGMAWTVLQPSCLMEIWFSPAVGWDVAGGRVRIYGTGERPVSYVSLEDVARVTVAALSRTETEGRDIPVGGPEPVTPLAAAAAFEAATGRRLRRQHIPTGVLRGVAHLVVPFQPTMGSLMLLGVAVGERGDVLDMAGLQRELSLRLTSVADYVARGAAAGAAG
jgi:uncharacterized protein YbjT (DUF2867 family)